MTNRLATVFLAVISFVVAPAAWAQSNQPVTISIEESQPLSDALQTFADQTELQVIFFADITEGKNAPALEGEFKADAALDTLLADTGLSYTFIDDTAVSVQAVVTDPGGASDSKNLITQSVLMAQNQTSPTTTERGQSDEDNEPSDQKAVLDEIIVTGTHIRGVAPESSPVRTYGREDIEISGAATAQEFIETLPSNFGGGSNSDIPDGLPNDSDSEFNSGDWGSMGSSVNLRGLGSGSTLVLLNGHRLAPSSGIGSFVDISMIPVTAIERVEVLSDGASSVYGSDAVAGVINFVLRTDFDGLEADLRHGTVTEGDRDEYRASVTAGKSWNSGNALFVYEFANDEDLSAADRSFSQGAPEPVDLLPSQRRHSALVTAAQQLTPDIRIFGDITYSTRDAVLENAVRGFRRSPSSTGLNINAGAALQLSDTWFLDISGTFSDLETTSRIEPLPDNPTGIGTTRNTNSELWAADARVSGTILSLPGGDLKLALGSHYRREDFSNFGARQGDRDVYAVFGEAYIPIVGSKNAIPGVERLELNVSGRYDNYSDYGSDTHPKVGILWSPVESLKLRGSYSTSFNPPPLGRVGVTDRAGSVFRTSLINSIFGLTAPDPSIADIAVLHVFGTSKDLEAEVSTSFTAGLDFDKDWGSHTLSLSATWFHTEFEGRLGAAPVPGNIVPFAAPNVAFADPGAFPPETVVFSPSQSDIDAVISSLDSLNAGFGLFGNVEDIEAINFVQVVRNLGITVVSGIDFNFSYVLDSEIGQWSLGADGTYIRHFQQQAASTIPKVERINTLYNPIDLNVRGRLGYSRDSFSANVFVNFADSYRTDDTAESTPIDSWTTFDLSVSYRTDKNTGNRILDNTTIRMFVRNLFDEGPPSTPSAPTLTIFGYDPTNASPINRLVAIQLSKRFY